ncbi:hypothetical protein PMAYCL1PPCAC_07861, partial [Pristionchus mayeri]
ELQSSDFFSQSNDSLLSLIAKGFETMSVSLSDDSDRKHVQCALLNLESQRKITMQFEDNDSDPLRSLTYGLIESIHLTLQKLHRKIDALQPQRQLRNLPRVEQPTRPRGIVKTPIPFSESENSQSTTPKSSGMQDAIPKEEKSATLSRRPKEASNMSLMADSDFKEEPFDEFQSTSDANTTPNLFSDDNIKQEEISDESPVDRMEGTNESYDFTFDEDGYYDDEEEGEGGEDHRLDTDRRQPKGNMKRPSRSVGMPKRYVEDYDAPGPSVKKKCKNVTRAHPVADEEWTNEMEGDDGEYEEEEGADDTSLHNADMKRTPGNGGKTFHPSTMSLSCPVPECPFFSRYPKTWLAHLRKKHNTTPSLANVALKCKCGMVSLSCAHANVCEISHFEVVRTNDGPIRRKTNSEWDTPICMMTRNNKPCNKRPSTLTSFTAHIHRDHNSSLIKEGYYLRCECGEEANTQSTCHRHVQRCTMHNFSLHKLHEGTPQQTLFNSTKVWPAPSL